MHLCPSPLSVINNSDEKLDGMCMVISVLVLRGDGRPTVHEENTEPCKKMFRCVFFCKELKLCKLDE